MKVAREIVFALAIAFAFSMLFTMPALIIADAWKFAATSEVHRTQIQMDYDREIRSGQLERLRPLRKQNLGDWQ